MAHLTVKQKLHLNAIELCDANQNVIYTAIPLKKKIEVIAQIEGDLFIPSVALEPVEIDRIITIRWLRYLFDEGQVQTTLWFHATPGLVVATVAATGKLEGK